MKKLLTMALALMLALSITSAFADTLIMATNAAFPPYEYIDGDQIVGIDAEIAAAIAAKMGYDFEIKDMEFPAIISEVQGGKVSFGMAGMTVTDERKQMVDFSES